MLVKQGFSNMASNWLAVVLPANQVPGVKIRLVMSVKQMYCGAVITQSIFSQIVVMDNQ